MLSILRYCEYNKISQLKIDGKILDLGGSKRSGYHELIKGNHEIITVNIDSNYDCDLIFDIQEEFPIERNSFDTVLLINVLEHIYNFKNVISESSRVLKTDESVYMAIPFMFGIHGSPGDFFRYSKQALKNILFDNDFEMIEIEELGFGFFSLTYQMFFMSITPSHFLKELFQKCFINFDRLILFISPRYRHWAINYPLGYWVSAKKKRS